MINVAQLPVNSMSKYELISTVKILKYLFEKDPQSPGKGVHYEIYIYVHVKEVDDENAILLVEYEEVSE